MHAKQTNLRLGLVGDCNGAYVLCDKRARRPQRNGLQCLFIILNVMWYRMFCAHAYRPYTYRQDDNDRVGREWAECVCVCSADDATGRRRVVRRAETTGNPVDCYPRMSYVYARVSSGSFAGVYSAVSIETSYPLFLHRAPSLLTTTYTLFYRSGPAGYEFTTCTRALVCRTSTATLYATGSVPRTYSVRWHVKGLPGSSSIKPFRGLIQLNVVFSSVYRNSSIKQS